MKKNQFLKVIAGFSDKDRKRFGDLIASPYFNTNLVLVHLYSLVTENTEDNFKKEAIWRSLFPGRAFSDNQLRKYFSDLNKLARRFVALEYLAKENTWEDFLYSNGLSDPEIQSKFLLKWLKDYQMPDFQIPIDSESHFFRYYIHRTLYFQNIRKRSVSSDLANSVLHLESFYIIENLKTLCEVFSLKEILGKVELPSFFNENVLEKSRLSPFCEAPLIRIYGRLADLFSGVEIVTHEMLAIMLKEIEIVSGALGCVELRTILNYLQNLYLRKIRLGGDEYIQGFDDLFDFRIRKGLMLSKGIVAPEDYKNRITLLLKLNRFDEAREFLVGFKDNLPQEHRGNSFFFSKGNIYFHEGNFEEMRIALQKLKDNDPFYFLDSKSLLIKAAFWEHDMESIPFYLDSYSKFLSRNNKLSSDRLKPYQERLRLFWRLFRLYERPKLSQARVQNLKKVLISKAGFSDRQFYEKMLIRLSEPKD